MRTEWGLNEEPIPNLVELLEDRGYRVIQIKLDEGSKLIGIDAILNDLRVTQKIRITKSDKFLGSYSLKLVAPPGSCGVKILAYILGSCKTFGRVLRTLARD